MLVELIGIYAAYKIADSYNKRKERENLIKNITIEEKLDRIEKLLENL